MTTATSVRGLLRPFTLADGLARRVDNFLLLRMCAAAAVIYGHAHALVVTHGERDLFVRMGWGSYSGTIAVDLFFIVSGFLVTGSYLRRRNVFAFAWARALRVVPGYAACLLASAFVLGAVHTTLPLATYFAHAGTLDYVQVNLKLGTQLIWRLPEVFVDNPRRDTINGSIWTLPAEVRMYLWVAFAGALGILARRWACTLLLSGLFVLGLLAPEHLWWVPHPAYVRLAGCFALGVLCYVHRDVIPANGWWLATCTVLAWALRHTPMYPFAFALAEAAFVFWFAYRTRWHGYNRLGDYSYGLYLWGYPMQQVVAHHLPATSPLANAALALPLALLAAVLSWHLVEKPAIGLKSAPRALRRTWLRWYPPRGAITTKDGA